MTVCWTAVLHPWETGRPSKTGQFDDGLALDGQWQDLLNQMMPLLVDDRRPDELLLGVDGVTYAKIFREAVGTSYGLTPRLQRCGNPA